MDSKLVYAKTPAGDEAVRESTRVVQRNLRMVLVLVDGKLTVQDLSAKIGDSNLVERALRELEEGGFIAPNSEVASIWQDSKLQNSGERVSALSQFSTFGPKTPSRVPSVKPNTIQGNSPSDDAARSSQSKVGSDTFSRGAEQENFSRGEGIPIRKLIVGGLLAVLVLLSGLIVFFPYDNLKPAFERMASSYLQTTVRIGRIGVGFSPLPQLDLMDVRLGEGGESRIEAVRIAAPYLLLWQDKPRLDRVVVSGATLAANQVIAVFSQAGGASVSGGRRPVIRQLRVERGQVTVRDLMLRDVSGEILFAADGSLEKSSFTAADRSINLEATSSPQGVVLNIDGKGWRPAGFPMAFDSFQAKGLLQKDKLLIQNLNANALGGVLQGTWLLDWRSGLAMAGDASLKFLDCSRVSAALVPLLKLEGSLSGPLRLRGMGNDGDSLWRSLEASLDADISRGVLHGVDLGEVARRGSSAPVRAGATKFDHLHVKLTINSAQTTGQDVQLDAGMMTAAGRFVVGRDRTVDGSLTVAIQSSVSSLRVPVRISGALPDLVASSRQ